MERHKVAKGDRNNNSQIMTKEQPRKRLQHEVHENMDQTKMVKTVMQKKELELGGNQGKL